MISKGLSYDKLELQPEEGSGFLTGPRLGMETVYLKILSPRNLCADEEDNAFPGSGFGIYTDKDSLLGEVDDLYKDSKEGMPLEYLKSLAMTLGFTDTATVKIGKKYLLKIRFLGKRGTAEALMVFPFTMTEHTEIYNSISTSSSSLGLAIMGGCVGAEVQKLTITQASTKEVTSHFKMTANTDYKINLSGLKDIGTKINYIIRVVDAEGDIVREENAKTIIANGNASFDITTSVLPLVKGGYTVWLKLEDEKRNSIGISIPVFLK